MYYGKVIIKGETSMHSFTIGVWGFYESQYYNNRIFLTPNAGIGDNLLKPMNELYRQGMEENIKFISLDMLGNYDDADAFLFLDFPIMDNPMVKRVFSLNKPKFLIILESPLIRPENWDEENLNLFYRVFSYSDIMPNRGGKYIKLNYGNDIPKTINKDLAGKEKLCTMIAGAKLIEHEMSLYPERINAIKWFEQNHIEDFDLYGIGWEKEKFSSYRGPVKSKNETLKKYKFSICYENIKDVPGYITEKIFDCFFAGCVPVYWGASNIADHIPANCFIDRRSYSSYAELYNHLVSMPEDVYINYLLDIEGFLESSLSYSFSIKYFTNKVISECVEAILSYRDFKPKEQLTSIIVCAYNNLSYTKQCVESIMKHTKTPYELILVNNGSTDGTDEYFGKVGVAKNNNPHNTTVVINYQENEIVEYVINEAFKLCHGTYVAFVSNDNLVNEGWLENLIDQMELSTDIGMVGPRANNISGSQLLECTTKNFNELSADMSINNKGKGHFTIRIVGMCYLTKKSILERVGGLDPNLPTNGKDGGHGFSDDDFSIRMVIAGYRLRVADDVLVYHYGSKTIDMTELGKALQINHSKYVKKLLSNPRVIVNGSQMAINPLTMKDKIDVPENLRI